MQAKQSSNPSGRSNRYRPLILLLIVLAAVAACIPVGSVFFIFLTRTSLGAALGARLQWLFAIDQVQSWWYITRAAGLVAYLLLWLSTAWGLVVSNKITDSIVHRTYTFEFHQFISLLAIGFMVLHILVLMLDHYLPFSALQILVPFTSTYRPLWVGLGVISFYLILLVTGTFYIRQRIGIKAFRIIHVLSLAAYISVTLHAIYAGTDSPLSSIQLLYKGSFLSVFFLTVYWLILAAQKRFASESQASRVNPT